MRPAEDDAAHLPSTPLESSQEDGRRRRLAGEARIEGASSILSVKGEGGRRISWLERLLRGITGANERTPDYFAAASLDLSHLLPFYSPSMQEPLGVVYEVYGFIQSSEEGSCLRIQWLHGDTNAWEALAWMRENGLGVQAVRYPMHIREHEYVDVLAGDHSAFDIGIGFYTDDGGTRAHKTFTAQAEYQEWMTQRGSTAALRRMVEDGAVWLVRWKDDAAPRG